MGSGIYELIIIIIIIINRKRINSSFYFICLTFDQYIQNPSSTNAVMSNREMYRKKVYGKLDKLMVIESGKIKYKLYRSLSKYYAHIKVPSETIKDFYYEVVLEFIKP